MDSKAFICYIEFDGITLWVLSNYRFHMEDQHAICLNC